MRRLTAPLLVLLTGCASQQTALRIEAVGPKNAGSSGRQGALVVRTATQAFNDGGIVYHHHTPYSILGENGTKVKSVTNHTGPTDQAPMIVNLDKGNYRVIGLAEAYGRVAVPVVIQGNRLTEVNLERGGIPLADLGSNTNVIRFPNGDIIGWQAPDRQP